MTDTTDRRPVAWWRASLNIASAVLFIATLIRLTLAVGALPIAGYANNYDFLRQSGCVGVWEHYPNGQAKELPSPRQPVDALDYDGQRRPDLCLPSSDNLFPWAVAHFHHKHATLTLHQIGWLKAGVAAALMLAVLLQPVPEAFRFGCAIAGFLMLGDFTYLLFFNSLYLDASLIMFAFASISLTCSVFCRMTRPGWSFILFLVAAIAWFVFARGQYAAFALLLGPLAAFGLYRCWRDRIGAAAVLVGIAMCVGGLGYFHAVRNEHTAHIAIANEVDTVLEAVLPSATDKAAALRQLGLPSHCMVAIGMNWYTPGFQQRPPCPEVYHLGRLPLIPLFMVDPATFFGPFQHAIVLTRPADMPYLGHFEHPGDENRLRFRLLAETSFTDLLARLPEWIFDSLVYASILAGATCFMAFVRRQTRAPAHTPDAATTAVLLGAIGGGLAFYGIASSVFGDGYGEVGRHAFGVDIGIALQVSAALTWGCDIFVQKPLEPIPRNLTFEA